jgi:hypothetical protein
MPIRERLAHWTDNKREDGMLVAEAIDGWIVLPHDDRSAISACPCCSRPFKTARSAQKAADEVYPLERQ